MEDVIEKQVMRKIFWRLVPMLMLMYVVSYTDRTNVGFAALTMNKDLGLSATAYGWGAGIFFIGYCLFEVPSNLMLVKVGARRWIARILATWGHSFLRHGLNPATKQLSCHALFAQVVVTLVLVKGRAKETGSGAADTRFTVPQHKHNL